MCNVLEHKAPCELATFVFTAAFDVERAIAEGW
jgi:hypothetical protein